MLKRNLLIAGLTGIFIAGCDSLPPPLPDKATPIQRLLTSGGSPYVYIGCIEGVKYAMIKGGGITHLVNPEGKPLTCS